MKPSEYLEWRSEFARLWQSDNSFMALISANQQYDLHTYLEFHRDKSDEESLSWLLTIQANEPEIEKLALDAGVELAGAFSRMNELTDQALLPSPLNICIEPASRSMQLFCLNRGLICTSKR